MAPSGAPRGGIRSPTRPTLPALSRARKPWIGPCSHATSGTGIAPEGHGDERQLSWFVGCPEASVEGGEAIVAAAGGDGRHVESIADALSAAADHALAALLSAVGIERGEAGQGSDGLGGARAEFGSQGEQGCGGDGTDAGDGAQPPLGLSEAGAGGDQPADPAVELADLLVEPAEVLVDGACRLRVDLAPAAGALLTAHCHHLVAPFVQPRQLLEVGRASSRGRG